MHGTTRSALLIAATTLTLGCNSDNAKTPSGPAIPLSADYSGKTSYINLAPDASPGDYLLKNSCEPFHAKAWEGDVFPNKWLTNESINWTTNTAFVLSFDDISPQKSSVTHHSGDAVYVCGINDGFGEIAARDSGDGTFSTPPFFDIDIGNPAHTVTISTPSAIHDNGPPVQLYAIATDNYGTARDRTAKATGTWTSSDPGVASVSSNGVLTPHAEGSTTIGATVYGVLGQKTVSVLGVATVSVSPASASIAMGRTVALTATAEDEYGNPFTGKTAAWTSSNTSIATVSSTGVVTGVASGQVTITATIDGVSGTSTITVTQQLTAEIYGWSQVFPNEQNTWDAGVSGGSNGYDLQWQGVLTASGWEVSGSLSQSGWLHLYVHSGDGQLTEVSCYITVTDRPNPYECGGQ